MQTNDKSRVRNPRAESSPESILQTDRYELVRAVPLWRLLTAPLAKGLDEPSEYGDSLGPPLRVGRDDAGDTGPRLGNAGQRDRRRKRAHDRDREQGDDAGDDRRGRVHRQQRGASLDGDERGACDGGHGARTIEMHALMWIPSRRRGR